MGRKPNALVSEFFNRGAKLHDSSNRYEHTCKLCGQNFPKGRTDSLMGHLMKACQAISTADKQRVTRIWTATPDRNSPARKIVGKRTVDLPLPGKRATFNGLGGLNGLNVLAEASRQVGASDHKHPNGVAHENGDGKAIVVDPALEMSSKQGEIDFNSVINHSPTDTTQYIHHDGEPSNEPSLPPNNSDLLPPDSGSDARQSQLSMIAASANEMVTQDGTLFVEQDVGDSNHSDEALGGMLRKFVDNHNSEQEQPPDQMVTQTVSDTDPATQRAAIYPRPIAMNPDPQGNGFVNGFGDASQPAKHKTRSQFSEERRKQVQLVRKMGACLRCRMLKKTCSPGDPCTQCENIQNPRVWMECCIRTRLAAQLEIYSTGLHSTLAYHDINDVKSQVQFDHSAGRIELFCFDTDPPNFVTFGALTGQKAVMPGLDPQLQVSSDLGFHMQDIHLLAGDGEELSSKMGAYMKRMATEFFEQEPSSFMKATLKQAWELHQNTPDDLLDGVLNLWISTRVLVDPVLQWKIFYNPSLPPTTVQPLCSTSNESRIPIEHGTYEDSYVSICTQLRAAAEKGAAKLAKSVLNKVEQRLVQKQKTGHFRTFLGSIILLNCVERMTWLFHLWDSAHHAQRWPLENRPPFFVSQAQRFAGIVEMHLKMRSLSPSSVYEIDTGLVRAKENSEGDEARWFKAVNLNPEELEEFKNAKFDPADSRSLDLKYCSRLIKQPDIGI